jgi:outer membrane protein assembly factor BamE (lipoprotein component of BamABCDE complex)
MRWSSVLALSATLAACASVGRDFDRTHVNDIKKGVHDKEQIRAWFGEPLRTATVPAGGTGCNERWIYNYAKSTWGGRKTEGATLTVGFDTKGKVCVAAYVEQQ